VTAATTLPPFQQLLDEHRDEVYRFLVFTAGPGEAADCFQETMLAALRGYPKLRDDTNLRGWLFTIAHHKAIDGHRARARRPVPASELPERSVPPVEIEDPTLWTAVRKLPEKQRAAVVLRFVADLPYLRIAAITGGTEAAARQNVRAGLTRLREEWTP
jgi:RNA polymerase sigma factor (sigma-70 family)